MFASDSSVRCIASAMALAESAAIHVPQQQRPRRARVHDACIEADFGPSCAAYHAGAVPESPFQPGPRFNPGQFVQYRRRSVHVHLNGRTRRVAVRHFRQHARVL